MNNALKWGVILGVAGVIMGLVFHLLGWGEPADTGIEKYGPMLVGYLVNVPILIMGIKAYKANNNNYLTVGDGITQGLLIALISGIILAIYMYCFLTFIAPDLLDSVRETAMDQQGEMSEEQEEMMSGMMGAFTSAGFMAGFTFIWRIFLGFFVGLITGAVMKNVRPYSEDTL